VAGEVEHHPGADVFLPLNEALGAQLEAPTEAATRTARRGRGGCRRGWPATFVLRGAGTR
jgi:hypothetical protein